MTIRTYNPADGPVLAQLFYDTVHTVNASDYTEEQLGVWAPKERDLEEWNRSLAEHITLVAVMDGQLVGFADLDRSGYLDRLFVHRDYQRQGIATALCDMLEQAAPVSLIRTQVSLTAQPFFRQRGYRKTGERKTFRNGVALRSIRMEKNVPLYLTKRETYRT